MRLGMTYTEAMSLPRTEQIVMGIVLGIQRGGEFDTTTMRWKKAPVTL